MAVMILMKIFPKVKSNVDYMDKKDLDEIWFKIKDKLKRISLCEELKKFDIRNVN